jgi:hypothetical protein
VRRATIAVAGLVLAVVPACNDDGPEVAPPTTPSPFPVATFRVADVETYKIALMTPELVDHAERLLAGEPIAAIPLGTVVRDDPGPNAPWSWHIDPASLEFAEITIEVCDGLPSYVEDGTVTSDQYCPWSAQVIAVDGV